MAEFPVWSLNLSWLHHKNMYQVPSNDSDQPAQIVQADQSLCRALPH